MFLRAGEAHLYALMRIILGFFFLLHGSQKLLGFPAGTLPDPLPPLLQVAGYLELLGGTAILIGLFTPVVAFVCSGLMASAYWIGHAIPALTNGADLALLPIANRGELAAVYCFVFLFMASRGAGIWSVDQALGRAGEPRGATSHS